MDSLLRERDTLPGVLVQIDDPMESLAGFVECSYAEYADANADDPEALQAVRESLATGKPVLCGYLMIRAVRAPEHVPAPVARFTGEGPGTERRQTWPRSD